MVGMLPAGNARWNCSHLWVMGVAEVGSEWDSVTKRWGKGWLEVETLLHFCFPSLSPLAQE